MVGWVGGSNSLFLQCLFIDMCFVERIAHGFLPAVIGLVVYVGW